MFVTAVDSGGGCPSGPAYSEFTLEDYRAGRVASRDWLSSDSNTNSVTFNYHFKEKTSPTDYQLPEVLQEQMTRACADFADRDFQLVTFNQPEQDRFGMLMPQWGFELMGDSPGNSNTPIYLWVKTKKE